jgi:hypothetical protein
MILIAHRIGIPGYKHPPRTCNVLVAEDGTFLLLVFHLFFLKSFEASLSDIRELSHVAPRPRFFLVMVLHQKIRKL